MRQSSRTNESDGRRDTPVDTKSCSALLFVDDVDCNHNEPRLIVAAPNNLYTVLRMPVMLHGDFHPFTRPFDWVAKHGGKDPGMVTYFLLSMGHPRMTAVLFSISLAGRTRTAPDSRLGGRRLLIFPGWGPEMLYSGLKPRHKNVGTHAHHITVEADKGTGKISTHITASRSPDGKPVWPRMAKKIRFAGYESDLIGTLLVRRIKSLEPAGIAVARITNSPSADCASLESRLNDHLSARHPVLELPPGRPWDDRNHLQIHFIITPSGKISERECPVRTVVNQKLFLGPANVPGETMHRLTKIELSPTANLVVAYAVVPGVLSGDFYW